MNPIVKARLDEGHQFLSLIFLYFYIYIVVEVLFYIIYVEIKNWCFDPVDQYEQMTVVVMWGILTFEKPLSFRKFRPGAILSASG